MKQGGGAMYGIGIFGALIYYWQNATTFWALLTGFVKAIFWPAVVVYRVFDLLNL